jgi:hypothetical protein
MTRNPNINHPVDNIYLTQEMADLHIRYLTQDQRGYLSSCFQHGTRESWVWGNRTTGEKLRQALIKKGMLEEDWARRLTPLGERTCAVLFPQYTPEGRAAAKQKRNEEYFRMHVEEYDRRNLERDAQIDALAKRLAEVADNYGTNLGFHLSRLLAAEVIGPKPTLPTPADYGL